MVIRGDKRPLHERIAADLRAKIMSGEFQPDEQLRSTSQLQEQYDASNPTIQRALDVLKDEGFLTSRRGKGVFVRDKQPFIVDVSTYFTPSPGGWSYDMLDVSHVHPPAEVAEAFDLADDELVVLRKRITKHKGEPVELCHSYYSLAMVEGTPLAEPGRIRGGAPRVLADLGHAQSYFEDQVAVRVPTSEEIELLDLLPGIPVIRQFRIVYSAGDRPVEVTVMIKGGNLYELRYRQSVD